MVDLRVNIEYFFRNPDGFPWDVLGLTRPYAAPLHAYLCDAALIFCDHNERLILIQRPALFEIRKFARKFEGIFLSIAEVCDAKGDVKCRFAKTDIVVNWLQSQPEFLRFMQKRLDSLWRQGLISMPEGACPGHEQTYKENRRLFP